MVKLIFLILIFGCTTKEVKDPMIYGDKDFIEAFLSEPKTRWFKTNKRFGLSNFDGEPYSHFFFDIKPVVIEDLQKIQFVITTPAKSSYEWQLDLPSGQHVLDKKYCPAKDFTGRSQTIVHTPPFSMGVVPQVLDQLQTPQKVIVFGLADYYQKHFQKHYFDGKVIGGIIDNVCYLKECKKVDQWKSRLILVAVPAEDPQFRGINTITELKKKIDWEEVELFLENGRGVRAEYDETYPIYKLGRVLEDPQTAFEHFTQNRIYFTRKKQKSLQNSCFKLYDHIWKYLGQKNVFEKKELSAEELKKLVRYINDLRKQKNKKHKIPEYFETRLLNTLSKYGKSYITCTHYVKNVSLNEDSERFWFFAYLDVYTKLYELGHRYDCRRKIWDKNDEMIGKNLNEIFKEDLTDCKTRDIEFGFEMAITYMENLAQNFHNSYRFVDYDNFEFGSHKKIHGWVYTDGGKLNCSSQKRINNSRFFTKFPKDIRFPLRSINRKKLENSLNNIVF